MFSSDGGIEVEYRLTFRTEVRHRGRIPLLSPLPSLYGFTCWRGCSVARDVYGRKSTQIRQHAANSSSLYLWCYVVGILGEGCRDTPWWRKTPKRCGRVGAAGRAWTCVSQWFSQEGRGQDNEGTTNMYTTLAQALDCKGAPHDIARG